MADNFNYNFPFFGNQRAGPRFPENPARLQEWVVDSGASGNCTCIGDFLYNMRRTNTTEIVCADGGTSSTSIMGEVNADGNGLLAKQVLYVPAVDSNLLSVGCLTKDDHVVVFDKNGCEIYNESDVIVEGIVKARGRLAEDGLYKLLTRDVNEGGGAYMKNLWHRRLCHIDITEIKLLQEYMALGINFEDNDIRIECLVPFCFNYFEHSISPLYRSALNAHSFPIATKALELVYFYLSISTNDVSLNGNKYYILLIDDYTRKMFIYFFRSELEIVRKLKSFKKYVENYTGNKIECMSTDMDLTLKKCYPFIESFTVANDINLIYNREPVPIIEWLKYIVKTKKQCLMADSNMPNEFWAEATNAVVSLLNICPSIGLPFITPQEAWSGLKPDLSVIKVFGCKAYLSCLNKYVIHLGYHFETGDYRFMDTSHYGIYFRKTAIFYEDVPFFKNLSKVI